MPNWCANILTVSGPVEDVERFMNMAKPDGEEYDLSLNALMPIPDEQKDNWYNWCITNWGTKWDVDAKITSVVENDDNKTVVYRFDSAWSPPVELFSAVLNAGNEEYDNLYFHLAYAESGMGFIGVAEGDVEEGFSDWCDECYDWKDWAYRAESLGFVGEIASYHEYQDEIQNTEVM